jgi:hypothetical protein
VQSRRELHLQAWHRGRRGDKTVAAKLLVVDIALVPWGIVLMANINICEVKPGMIRGAGVKVPGNLVAVAAFGGLLT